jgi:hypothetical protein
MEGNLKKFVEKVKVFQMSIYPMRYFLIDFTSANIYIKHDKNVKIKNNDPKNSKVKVIPFRSVKDCYLARSDVSNMSLPKGWQHAFYVVTIDRLYVLCSPSDEERKMWMAGFRYVIASTLTVQVIMKHNNI